MMLRYRIEIDLENEVFDDDPAHETAGLLRRLANHLESFGMEHDKMLRDHNGNRVGIARLEGLDEE
jgi:hypothetical protein